MYVKKAEEQYIVSAKFLKKFNSLITTIHARTAIEGEEMTKITIDVLN